MIILQQIKLNIYVSVCVSISIVYDIMHYILCLQIYVCVYIHRSFSFYFYFLMIYIFMCVYEREREGAHGGRGRGRERERTSSRLPAECGAWPRAQSQDPKVMTWAEIGSCMLNQLSHPPYFKNDSLYVSYRM